LITKSFKKGTTLLELVIVLALSSMITLSLVLLIDSMTRITTATERSDDLINSTSLSRTFITNWFSSFDEENNIISVDDNGNIKITKESLEYKLYNDGTSIIAEYYDGDNKTYIYPGLVYLSFSEIKENKLYKCEIKYMINEEPETYTFLLSRRS